MYAGDQTAAMRGERSTDPLRLLFLLVLMLNPLSVSHASSLVGSPVCGDCHAAQTDAWRASHHARAMQPAAPETINARWSDSFSLAGVTSRFERAGERFLVHTIDANGRPDTFPVRYTFDVAWARDPTRSAKPLHAGFRTGFPVRERVQTTPGASALLRPRSSNPGSTTPTVSSRTRSSSGVHSCKAACTPPA